MEQEHEGLGLEQALIDIIAERKRQKTVEGHDDEQDVAYHLDWQLALAGACYALGAALPPSERAVMDRLGTEGTPHHVLRCWPWEREYHKPKDRRRDLVRAAALIAAQIAVIDNSEVLE